jgi:hypothetical protein
MVRECFYVLADKTGWRVLHAGEDVARTATKAEAVDQAVALARAHHEAGGKSQVLIMRDDGRWQEERTYGDDPPGTPG